MLEIIEDESDAKEIISSKVRDNVILHIVNLVNNGEITLGITLFCKGTVIAGDVIPGSEYFSSMSESCAGKSSILQKLYTDIGCQFYGKDPHPLNYIHLKNVVVKGAGSTLTPFEGGLLRMRIDEIDGHIVGRPS
ncbi:hypothetical protein D4N02_25000 [Klebsiella pneumoniae]|uniref:hypothetical protein n=1 Tax=Klebsiella pneumoniae TaxID=573 RepID=UPI0011DDE015|nr:hypothetical protein [Klebsiella pneumoniae]TXU20367.1 hypothetical protein D4N02_25000 [Klebsiella pneumoniae]